MESAVPDVPGPEGGAEEKEKKTLPRYLHPRTGEKLPDVAFFEPGGCHLMDGGRTLRVGDHARGVIHYLATAGNEEWANPADREGVCAELQRRRDESRSRAEKLREEEMERRYALCRVQCEDKRTRADHEILLGQVASAASGLEFLETELRSERTLRRPHIQGIEAIRRQAYELRSKLRELEEDAESLRRSLDMRTAYTIGLDETRKKCEAEEARASELDKSMQEITSAGFVNVTTSGWQRGREIDIVGLLPTHSWSRYTFHTDGCEAADAAPPLAEGAHLKGGHPEGKPSGSWFQVDLPSAMRLYPSHYALRHGDDASQLHGVRHDSDCVLTSTCAGEDPKTSWGGTTRARGDFTGAALTNWELWGYAVEDAPLKAGWVPLSRHVGDTSLHGPWATAVWPVEARGRQISSFRVVMTGPTLNGGHSLFCSGFDVFGQVGEPEKVKPLPKPPRGIQYLYTFELYTCGVPIEPNRCVVESGTNDADYPMVFTVSPALPAGLILDAKDGEISGSVDYDRLELMQRLDVDRGKVVSYQIMVDNGIGQDVCQIKIVIMRPPVAFKYEHTDVTYQSNEAKMAFSKEIIDAAVAKKWKQPTDGPVDLNRTHVFNKPIKESNLGTAVSWPSTMQMPQVAGNPVIWEEPWVWPKFRVEPELLDGMTLDPRTGRIGGAPTKEAQRQTWTVYACNPVGETVCSVHMRVLDPPSDLTFEATEMVLSNGMPWENKVESCNGTKPLNFRADTLPIGLTMDAKTGLISGEPNQVDDDFVEYDVFAWNEVGEAKLTLRLLTTIVETQQDEAAKAGGGGALEIGRIVNKDVSARVGMRVEGTEEFIQWRERQGLADESATPERSTEDCRRSRVLNKEAYVTAKSLSLKQGSRGGVSKPFVAAVEYGEEAGRGTVLQVWDMGRMCQVRWDKTGLVAHYNTGAGGHYFLQTWGTSQRCVASWMAIPPQVRATLHEDLVDPELDPYVDASMQPAQQHLVDKFLDEYNFCGVSRAPVPKAKLVGVKHTHPKSRYQQCPRGAGILQRLINELDHGWGQLEEKEDGVPEIKTEMHDGGLYLAMQIKDGLAGRVVDWDLLIAFFEFVGRIKGRAAGKDRVGEGGSKAAKDQVAGEGEGGRKSRASTRSSISTNPKKRSGGCSALEERAAHVWLGIDPGMRKSLRDRMGEDQVADALLAFMSQHIRRLSKLDFLRGLTTLSNGLNLHINADDCDELFRQTDFDKDGYITFLDFVKAAKESASAEAAAKKKQKEGRRIPKASPDVTLFGRRQRTITWPDVMRKIYKRPTTLTFAPAGDIHTVVNGAVDAVFPTRERALNLDGNARTKVGWKEEGWKSRLDEDRENYLLTEERAKHAALEAKTTLNYSSVEKK